MAKFRKQEVEKNSLDKVKMEEQFVELAQAEEENTIKVEEKIPARRIDSFRSPSLSTDISDGKKTNPKKYSNYTTLDESDIRRHNRLRQDRRSRPHRSCRRYRSTTPPPRKQDLSESDLEALVPVNERYQKAVDNRSYPLIQKS